MKFQVKMSVFLILLSLLITSCKGNNNNIDEPTDLITELPAVVTNIQKIVPHPYEEKYAVLKDYKVQIYDLKNEIFFETDLSVNINTWKNDSVLYAASLSVPSALLEVNVYTNEIIRLVKPYSDINEEKVIHNTFPVYNMNLKTLCFNTVGQQNGLGFNGLVFLNSNNEFTLKEVGLKPTWGGESEQTIYFFGYYPETKEADYYLAKYNIVTKEETKLFDLETNSLPISNIDVNKDGDKLLICGELSDDYLPQIYIYDLFEKKLNKLTELSYPIQNAFFSSNNDIVFTIYNEREYSSYSFDLNTRTVKPILNDIDK